MAKRQGFPLLLSGVRSGYENYGRGIIEPENENGEITGGTFLLLQKTRATCPDSAGPLAILFIFSSNRFTIKRLKLSESTQFVKGAPATLKKNEKEVKTA